MISQSNIERLRDISILEKGWFDGDGVPYTTEQLNKVRALLIKLEGLNFKIYIYPHVDESINLEWDLVDWSLFVTFEFSSNTNLVSFEYFNHTSNETFISEYSLDDIDFIASIINDINIFLNKEIENEK